MAMRILKTSNNNNTLLFLFSGSTAFTLLEIMVAMAILAIALTTLFGAQARDLSLATKAKFITNASLLADLKLAELKSGKLAPVDGQGDFGQDFPGYKWKMRVKDAADGAPVLSHALAGHLLRVDLTISWANETSPYQIRYYLRPELTP